MIAGLVLSRVTVKSPRRVDLVFEAFDFKIRQMERDDQTHLFVSWYDPKGDPTVRKSKSYSSVEYSISVETVKPDTQPVQDDPDIPF
jgi:hypothetical protein